MPAYFPATKWGGPIYSVHAMCGAVVGRSLAQVKVLASDAASSRLDDVVRPANNPTEFAVGYEVFYCRRIFLASFSPELCRRLPALVRWADVVHLTGVYSFPTVPTLLACLLLRKPLLWSPRGSFYRWKGARRTIPKAAWNWLCKRILPGRCEVHCTSEKEVLESHHSMPGLPTVVIPNGVDVSDGTTERPARTTSRTLRVIYLGLISPVKALDRLIEAMDILGPGYELIVYGAAAPGYEGYEARVRAMAQTLGRSATISFHGFVSGQEKEFALRDADVLVVPSHSENFSNVVCEALAVALPVIVSKGAPWQEIEARGCGIWTENSPQSLAAAIERLRGMDRVSMGARGKEWMREKYSWGAVAQSFADVYRRLVFLGTRK